MGSLHSYLSFAPAARFRSMNDTVPRIHSFCRLCMLSLLYTEDGTRSCYCSKLFDLTHMTIKLFAWGNKGIIRYLFLTKRLTHPPIGGYSREGREFRRKIKIFLLPSINESHVEISIIHKVLREFRNL